VAGCCENGNEPSSYIKCGDFFEYLMTYWLLKKDDGAWSYLVVYLVDYVVS